MAISLPIVTKFDDKGLNAAEKALKGVAVVGAAAFAAAAAGAIAFTGEALKAAAEAEAVTRGLENAAKNAGVFGDSAKAISRATDALDAHSRALGEMSGIDDEIINQMKTGWLAVPDLAARGTDGINRLAEVVADVAAGTGKDVQAIGLAFQRIAGDSETAFSKLTRAGIVFTDEQKATYQALLDTSGEIEAQSYLIETLGDKYEGAAEAAADPFARLQVIFGNLKEDIGAQLLPAVEAMVPLFQELFTSIVSDPEFTEFLQTMSAEFQNMLPYLSESVLNLFDLGKSIMPTLIDAMPALNELFGVFTQALDLVTGAGSGTNSILQDVFASLDALAYYASVAMDALDALGGLLPEQAQPWTDFLGYLTPVTGQLQFMGDQAKWAKDNLELMVDLMNGSELTRTRYMQWIRDIPVFGAIAKDWMYLLNPSATNPRRGGPQRTPPRTAKGGFTAMEGLQWVGEKGPELLSMPRGATVTPIPQHMRAENLVGSNRGGGNVVNYNIQVTGGMGVDGAQLGEQIVTAIRKYERTSGAVFARA